MKVGVLPISFGLAPSLSTEHVEVKNIWRIHEQMNIIYQALLHLSSYLTYQVIALRWELLSSPYRWGKWASGDCRPVTQWGSSRARSQSYNCVKVLQIPERQKKQMKECVSEHGCGCVCACAPRPGHGSIPQGQDLLEERELIFFIFLCPEHSIGPSNELQ